MVVVKCVALVIGLVLVAGYISANFLSGLPEGAVGVVGLVVGVLVVWGSIYGCRRIVRSGRVVRR